MLRNTLVVSDAHEGLRRAIAESFQGAAWQRCITHLMRNVAGHIRGKGDQRVAREAMKAAFAQKSPLVARACYQRAAEEVARLSPAAGRVMMEAEEEALAYLAFPVSHRSKIRTNNVQERANREIKRRTNVVQGFPSRESLIRLVGAALIEADGEWSARCVILCLATVFSTFWLPGSDNLAKEPPMSQISAFPSIKALSILLLVPLNSTSLPWWTTLSIIAEASLSSPRIVPHLLNSMLVVNTTLRFS